MSKKDYEAIAVILNDMVETERTDPRTEWAQAFDVGYASAAEDAAEKLSDYFAKENTNFNRELFLTACGL